jgi:hypothetical protein
MQIKERANKISGPKTGVVTGPDSIKSKYLYLTISPQKVICENIIRK